MKVLIIKPSSLGDVVHALRVVALIKEKLKAVQIHWVIKRGLEGIIDASDVVDKTFIFHRGKGLGAYWKLGLDLQGESYDMVLDMQGLLRSAFLAKLARGKCCLGRPDGREFSTFFYKTINSPSKEKPHAIERLCSFLEVFNLAPDQGLNLAFRASVIDSTWSANLPPQHNKILLFPESRRKEKCWPFFKELSQILVNEDIGHVIVSGIQKDDSYTHAIDLRGRIPLRSIPALIRKASVVISNDSAPLHIASAMGIPVLGIFGPTEPIEYGPYPASKKNGEVISSSTDSISEVTVRQVFDKILSMLDTIS